MIMGVDEVGRGCWAGPLVAAAVVMRSGLSDSQLLIKDSKILSANQRLRAYNFINNNSRYIGLGWVSSETIDEIGLAASVVLAMNRAVEANEGFAGQIIVDGNINYLKQLPNSRAVIKADSSVPAVSAASIVAKVSRDKFMTYMSEKFPNYGFDKHVGYGTAQHAKALAELGVCDIHRRSFKPISRICKT